MSDIPRKSIETLGFRLLNQGLAVVTSVLLARMLGPYGKGVFTFVTAVAAIFTTISAGESAAISWQYGRLKRFSGDVIKAMFWIWRYPVLALTFIMILFSVIVPGQRVLLWAALAIPLSFFSQMTLGFLLADGDVRSCNIQSLLPSVAFFFGLIPALFIFHANISVVLVLWVASLVVSAGYSLAKLLPYRKPTNTLSWTILKEQYTFALKVSANALVGLLNFRIDIFVIQFLLGSKAVGIYSIAIGVGELMWQLSRPLAFAAFGTVNSGTKEQAAQLTAKCVRHSLVLVSAGCLILFAIGPWLITLVYGQAFSGAGTALRLLLPGIIAFSMTPFLSGYFVQQLGKPHIQLVILTVSTIVCAVITIATVKQYGIAAGAVATSISYITAYVLSMFLFRNETGIPLRELLVLRRDDLTPYRSLVAGFLRRRS